LICTLFNHGHRFTFKHLCWHSITKILRNGPRAHFPFTLELAILGNSLRYNSPDCPVYTGLSGEPAEQRLLRANGHLQAHLMRARSAQKSGTHETVHRTIYSTCPVYTGQPGGPKSQKLQRSNPNGLVTWLAHRTCPVCTGLSGAPYDSQPPPND
jgi:hypothetical protein